MKRLTILLFCFFSISRLFSQSYVVFDANEHGWTANEFVRDTLKPIKTYKALKAKYITGFDEAVVIANKYILQELELNYRSKISPNEPYRVAVIGNYFFLNRLIGRIGVSMVIDRRNSRLITFERLLPE